MNTAAIIAAAYKKAAEGVRAPSKPTTRVTTEAPRYRNSVRKHTSGLREVRYED